MEKLIEYRNAIDKIDEQIINLFEKRMEYIDSIIEFKKQNNIAITDTNREQTMLQTNLTKIKNDQYKPYYHFVLDGFLAASKQMQTDKNNK